MTFFDYELYFNQNLFSSFSYERLRDLVTDDDALRAHVKNVELWLDDIEIEKRVATLRTEYNGILSVFGNQMIVFHCTMLDSMIENFFFSIFVSKPERMNSFFSKGELKDRLGFSLNGFLEAESKEAYILYLARKAAKICTEGGPKKYFKKLRDISRCGFSEMKMDTLDDLYITRNNIVHDNALYRISIDSLNQYTNTVQEVLFELHEALTKMNIVVEDSLISQDIEE
ncbi:hypothetical protein [Paenibacillus illinoisensis]|uniref:RiboL-PSP-HEPN domain-containing protein n=1 Tax=Paenibacillus illinoisensis TaxID=59845 RepID=A0A2W0CNI2_9BACL|nr:hypothetical protein [Paenibacillus illinoisensis]PYY29755.1 Uncharacterized protein PIL02S_01955 [Paenibacillus illinoisensis]